MKEGRERGEREGENKRKISSVNSFKTTVKALVRAAQIKSGLGLERKYVF